MRAFNPLRRMRSVTNKNLRMKSFNKIHNNRFTSATKECDDLEEIFQ